MSKHTPVDTASELSRRLAVLGRLSTLLARDFRAGEACQATLALALEALGVGHGALFSCDGDGEITELFAISGWDQASAWANLQQAAIPRSLLPVPDADGTPALSHRFPPRELLQRFQMADGISAIIAVADGHFLCLCLFSTDQQGFSDLDLEFLRLIASMLAPSMKYTDLMQGETHAVRAAILAKQEWEATVDVLPQVVCLLDRDMRILRANRAVESWGLGRVGQMPGRPLAALLAVVAGADRQALDGFPKRAAIALRGHSHYRERLEDQAHDQNLSLNLRRLGNEEPADGDAQAWAAFVMEDITERCRAETTLKRYNQDLEQKVRQRTEELRLANESLVRQVEAYEMAQIALEKSRQDLQILSSQLLAAQETERKRIACELHDGVGQTLSAIKFRIEHLMNTCEGMPLDDSKQSLSETVTQLRDAVEEIRRISMNLRPSILDDLGIVATLSWFVREFQKTYGGLNTELEILVDEQQVPEAIKIVIFRIIQEASNNVVKHAGASTLTIRLETGDRRIVLYICDDGNGFDVAQALAGAPGTRGTGLSSMQERAHLSGGNCEIRSTPGLGTEVAISWPTQAGSVELVFDGVGHQGGG